MGTCARCGAELGVGRFCVNCGHRIGTPVPPGEDLLPWEPDGPTEHDDEPRDPRVHPLAWVAGAAVLVSLVLVLLSWLGEAGVGEGPAVDESTPTATARPSPTGSSAPAPKGRARDVARTATAQVPATAPDSRDLDGTVASYAAELMLDGRPDTAWRMPGDATGETLTFRLAQATELVRVGLVNGYAKQVEGVSWYPLNRRITTVEWVLDDGTTVRQDLAQDPAVQQLRIEPTTTSTVQLRILGVTGPGPGSLGRDYTAVSEVILVGRPG